MDPMNHNLILNEALLPDLACRDMQVTKGDRVQYVTTFTHSTHQRQTPFQLQAT
jgi:hypothetical protein